MPMIVRDELHPQHNRSQRHRVVRPSRRRMLTVCSLLFFFFVVVVSANANPYDRLWKKARKLSNDDNYYAANDDDDYHNNKNTDDASNGNSYYHALDLTNFALKYVGCRTVQTWYDGDGSNNNDDDSYSTYYNSNGKAPLKTQQFAIFRLCPSRTCSKYNDLGCNSDYASYIMPLSDYLQLVEVYYIEQRNTYCETCQACMTYQSPTPAPTNAPTSSTAQYSTSYYSDDTYMANSNYNYRYNNNNGNRNLNYNSNNNKYTDDYYTDDYTSNKNEYPWYIENGQCIFSSVCANYQLACNYNNNNANMASDYLTCTKLNNAYTGPQCHADGHTIGVGLFDDPYCRRYLGDMIAAFGTLDDAYTTSTCISCNGIRELELVTDATLSASSSSTTTATITNNPLCVHLLVDGGAAPCHAHLRSSSSSTTTTDDLSMYLSSNQINNQDEACQYIQALESNSYNEYGEIVLFDKKSKQGHSTTESIMLMVGLVLSIGMAISLGVYALVLRRKLWLRRKRLWMPPPSTPNSSSSRSKSNNRKKQAWDSHDDDFTDNDTMAEEESSIWAWNRHRQEQRRKAGRWSSRFRSATHAPSSSWRSPKQLDTGSQNSILTDVAATAATVVASSGFHHHNQMKKKTTNPKATTGPEKYDKEIDNNDYHDDKHHQYHRHDDEDDDDDQQLSRTSSTS